VCASIISRKNRLRRLKTKKAQPTAAQNSFLPPENIWLLLRKTKEKAARSGDQFNFLPSLVPLYDEARNYFLTKS